MSNSKKDEIEDTKEETQEVEVTQETEVTEAAEE